MGEREEIPFMVRVMKASVPSTGVQENTECSIMTVGRMHSICLFNPLENMHTAFNCFV